MSNISTKLALIAMLCASLFFSCTSDLEMPPPPLPPDELSSSSEMPSSSSHFELSSSSLGGFSSSSVEVLSSSSTTSSSSSPVELSSSSAEVSSSSVGIPSSSGTTPSSSSSLVPSSSSIVPSSSSSSYTGNIENYKTVRIGNQVWMAENLNNDVKGSICCNCTTYGRLYDWATAMDLPGCNNTKCASQVSTKHRGICPSGWHIPSDAEWTTLTDFAGGLSTAATKLSATSGWDVCEDFYTGIKCEDTYGFSALPGGFGSPGCDGVGRYASWWTATEHYEENAYFRQIFPGGMNATTTSKGNRRHSVRCVQD